MRQLPGRHYVATYSHTDDEVRFLLRFTLLTGSIIGATLALFIVNLLG